MFTILIKLVLIFCFFLELNGQTDLCEVSWEQPIQISNDSIYSTVPQIVIANNAILIFWFGNDFAEGGGINYCRSIDNGKTFSPPTNLINYEDCLGMRAVAAGADNNVYIAYSTIVGVYPYYALTLRKSTDAGESWLDDQILELGSFPITIVAEDSFVYIHYLDQQNQYGIIRSSNYGKYWIRINSPIFTALISSNHYLHGVSVLSSGNILDVLYSRSTDFGLSWTITKILSSEDLTSSIHSTICSNDDGNIYAAWNDNGMVVLRRSIDNGLNWHPEVKLSVNEGDVFPKIAAYDYFVCVAWENTFKDDNKLFLRSSNTKAISFCPTDSPTTSTRASELNVAFNKNTLLMVWTELHETDMEIFFRRGTLITNPMYLPPTNFALMQNYPNPFNETTNISYHLPETSYVSLKIYNILGQEVVTLVNDYQIPKRYVYSFTGSSYPSGVYFYSLSANKFFKTKKLVIVR